MRTRYLNKNWFVSQAIVEACSGKPQELTAIAQTHALENFAKRHNCMPLPLRTEARIYPRRKGAIVSVCIAFKETIPLPAQLERAL